MRPRPTLLKSQNVDRFEAIVGEPVRMETVAHHLSEVGFRANRAARSALFGVLLDTIGPSRVHSMLDERHQCKDDVHASPHPVGMLFAIFVAVTNVPGEINTCVGKSHPVESDYE